MRAIFYAIATGCAGFAGTAGLLLATGNIEPAAAQALARHNSRAPVDVGADAIEVESRADRVVFSGNVDIEQAGLHLSAQRVTVAYSDAGRLQINRIDATGGVVVTKGGDRATGASAIYDLDNGLITLLGNVELQQGANRLSGGRMAIDLTSGRARVDGRAAPGGAPGTAGGVNSGANSGDNRRVTGRFTVPQRTTPATPPRP